MSTQFGICTKYGVTVAEACDCLGIAHAHGDTPMDALQDVTQRMLDVVCRMSAEELEASPVTLTYCGGVVSRAKADQFPNGNNGVRTDQMFDVAKLINALRVVDEQRKALYDIADAAWDYSQKECSVLPEAHARMLGTLASRIADLGECDDLIIDLMAVRSFVVHDQLARWAAPV